ncbi:MAG TPA: hypothetical protein DDZ80_07065 [Cyanobacteria bacterium UBA8803]|nr:hypothetical protein [Cyanobacteria bacterium UBA9273]HBL58279.1 hypothetical protein [Cyanobacteria bacterium UBA8803]
MSERSARSWQYPWVGALILSGAIAFSTPCALAQITSDNTLGTVVDPNLAITGGTTVGSNLFHSFSLFSVPDGATADFQNGLNIVNILSRVTGGEVSNIQGIIKAQGNANLFLMNPSGIVFGPNARLDLRGSFVGTTASALRFPGGGEFSMTSPVDSSNTLLVVNPSALFFNQTPAGAIVNQSGVLAVDPGQNLFLVGGDVTLNGGIVRAPGGRIELGGLATPGVVEIEGHPEGSNPNLNFPSVRLNFPDGVTGSNVTITNGAVVDVVANGGGDIVISGQNINIAGASTICAGIGTPSSCNTPKSVAGEAIGQAGNIGFNATGAVSISGGSRVESDLNPGAIGNSANIFEAIQNENFFGSIIIMAPSFSLTGQAEISTTTWGQGSAGLVFLDIDGPVSIDDGRIFSTVESGAQGSAGGILIRANSLSMTNNAQLQTLIRGVSEDGKPGGSGEAGSVLIETTGSVSLSQSAIFSTIGEGADGRSYNNPFGGNLFGTEGTIVGSIIINSDSLSLTDNSTLDASTLGTGNAGAVLIIANDEVDLTNGSGIFSTVGENAAGNAGGVYIVAESLSITNPRDTAASGLTTQTEGAGDAGLVIILTRKDVSLKGNSLILSTALENSSGDSGGILIDARSVFLKEGAAINVNNLGLGEAGAVIIEAGEDIILLDESQITAVALSGNGGNIELTSGDFLLALERSEISTTSGSLFSPGNGGDIDIDTRFVIAAPANNNDISANAFDGKGGNIFIIASRLYDIEKRPLFDLTNDINADSDFGTDGIVTTNVLNADPTQGLTNLQENPIDPATLIAETCAPRGGIAERQKNQFIVTGRGGLPPDPNAAFPGEAVVTDWGTPNQDEQNNTHSNNPTLPTTAPEPPIVEAQGWVYGENGDVIFTAQAPTVTPNSPALTPASTCNVF